MLIVDTYFLINWLETDGNLHDVVAARNVVPPEDYDILDLTPGMPCRVIYNSKFYPAQIVNSGKCMVL